MRVPWARTSRLRQERQRASKLLPVAAVRGRHDGTSGLNKADADRPGTHGSDWHTPKAILGVPPTSGPPKPRSGPACLRPRLRLEFPRSKNSFVAVGERLRHFRMNPQQHSVPSTTAPHVTLRVTTGLHGFLTSKRGDGIDGRLRSIVLRRVQHGSKHCSLSCVKCCKFAFLRPIRQTPRINRTRQAAVNKHKQLSKRERSHIQRAWLTNFNAITPIGRNSNRH